MGLGFYGKHPGRGDFLDHGLPEALQRALEGWLDGTLAEARAELGPAWETTWAAAPVLRFWLGEAIWGHTVCGVMAPSADRVGRRFPLVFLYVAPDAAAAPPPPVTDPDQRWYDHAEAALLAQLADPAPGPGGAMLTGLRAPQGDGQAGDAGFWARRADGTPAALWGDVALTDHRRAAAGRSYWWAAIPGEDTPETLADTLSDALPDTPPDPAAWDAPAPEPETESETDPDTGTDDTQADDPETDTPAGTDADTAADQPEPDDEAEAEDDIGADTSENDPVSAQTEPESDTPDDPADDPTDVPDTDETPDDPFAELPEEEDSPFGAPQGDGDLLAAASAWAVAADTAASPWDAPEDPLDLGPPISVPAPATAPSAVATPAAVATAPVTPAAPTTPPGPRLYAGPGLPDGPVMGWLLSGGA